MTKVLATLAVVLAVLLPGTPAWAHAQLVAAEPVQDAVLARAPAAVVLTFSQRLDPAFATIVVSDAGRQRVPASAPVVDAVRGSVTPDRPLGNGGYTVAYRVVSVDGHVVQGSYAFTVADPALPPAAAAPSDGTAAPAGSDGAPGALLIGLGAAGVVGVLAAVLVVVSRRRRAVSAPGA